MTETAAPDSPPLLPQLRRLASQSALYGAADVFTNLINFLLVPLYTAYLSLADYGTLALLILFGTVAKIAFRLGLDSGFFRVHYDLATASERRKLAGTVVIFSALAGGFLFATALLSARPLARALLGSEALAGYIVLAAADVYLGSFAFVPLSLLRIQERPGLFTSFSSLRHALNIVLKVVLLTRGFGVAGILWSDLIATGVFSLALLPVALRNASWSFSGPLLRDALGFGLPKVPHGILIQALNLADRKILDLFVTRAEVGLYQVGYTFGSGVKFVLSAFEPAWQPFVYARARVAEGPRTLARVVTYAWAAFLTTGLTVAVLGRELLTLLTPGNPAFRAAAPVIPVVSLAYLFHGAFLLTSIGIGIEKRARYYPVITAAAAGTNIAANFLLIPSLRMMGAAWATVVSYALMAAMGFTFARRLYPIPFEGGKLLRLTGAAALTWAVSLLAPEALWPALAVKSAVLIAFPALIVASGGLGPAEREWVRRRFRGPWRAGRLP